MNRDITKPDQNPGQHMTFDAYREAANAEADAIFDDRALESQRHKILARLAHLAHPAKVIPFPMNAPTPVPAPGVNRRWISIAAAAGLIIGLLGGQIIHLLPAQTRRLAPMASSIAPTAGTISNYVPARATLPQDDGLLGEVDFAVQLRSASELQTLDELTPFHDPQ